MKSLKFVVGLVVLLALIYLGNTHGAINPRIPGIAAFLNPFTGIWQQADAAKAANDIVVIPGDIAGEVVIDQRGIPHVFAQDKATAIYIQGYLHARDRLFQMDVSTRSASGRLAEILGSGLLERDRIQRRKGMLVAAQRTVAAWQRNPETAVVVNAYCDGVNAYISQLAPKDYPVEYKLLGFAPELWTPLKSALFSKSMAETLCFRNHDLATTNARALLGDSLFQHLFPEHNPAQSPVISATPWLNQVTTATEGATEDEIGALSFPELAQSPEGIGSNNWALAGSKTASGAPLLSNDPHLSLTLPSIWYEIHLVYGEENIYGVSLPSLPSILIGFNEATAWGITNVGQDVADWYKITWTDTTRTHYWLDGEAAAVDVVTDTIYVKGAAPTIIETPWTIFGPVVYDQPEDEYYNLALRWVAHDKPFQEDSDNVEVFLDLASATNLEGYISALRAFDNPGSNVVYANQANDIALTVTGHFPARRPQQGRFVQDGSRSANAWPGFIPYEEIPRDVNPERQFVASANQRSADLSYPYYYLGSFDDYRGRYINRHLEGVKAARPEDMMALQYDAHSLRAEEAVPMLLKSLATSPQRDKLPQKGIELLKTWDFVYRAQSQAPIVFDSWLDSLYKLTFDEVYALHSTDRPVMFPETWRLLELLKDQPEDLIFDHQATAAHETAQDLILQAYKQAMAAISPILAAGTTWSEHRDTRIRHLASIPGFGSDLIESDGAKETPNALSSDFGPSWRMVVSLEKPLRAWGVLPGGSSGNVGSPFYTKGIEEWSKGEYFELSLYRNAEEVPARQRLVFE
jgi:penicillin amidase